MRRRISTTRWPERETVDDDSQGVPLATVQQRSHGRGPGHRSISGAQRIDDVGGRGDEDIASIHQRLAVELSLQDGRPPDLVRARKVDCRLVHTPQAHHDGRPSISTHALQSPQGW